MNYNEIESLIRKNQLQQALEQLNFLVQANPDDDRALFLRGKVYWRLGLRPQATSDYAAASLLNPDSPATEALRMARDIEDFFNPDLLNP